MAKQSAKRPRPSDAAPTGAPPAERGFSRSGRRKGEARDVADGYSEDEDLVETAVAASASAGGFGAALSKILTRELRDAPSAGPVLAKRHTAAAKLASAARTSAREEGRARERKRVAAAARNVLPSALTADYERQLRKVGTKGVVALFNAIATHQRVTEAVPEDGARPSARAKTIGAAQASFLDLLRTSAAAAATGGAGAGAGDGGAGGGAGAGAKVGASTAGGGAAAALVKGGAKPAAPSRVAWLGTDYVQRSAKASGARAREELEAGAEGGEMLLDGDEF